jgi:hypothetical protein
MVDVLTGVSKMVYNAPKNPNQQQFMAVKLTPGNPYGFTLIAFNFNGPSIASEIAIFKPCTVPWGL